MTQDIHQLMLRTKAGEAQAFDDLVRRLRRRAFHVAHALVGSRDDALELSQETFMKVFRARDSFREGEAFLPWFHRILRNTCFSHLRKRGRLRQLSLCEMGAADDGDWELVDENTPPPSAALEHGERHAAFHTGLCQLSAKDREILVLRHFQDLSYKEIAESLDLPQGTVMSRLFHARRRLRDQLQESLGEPIASEEAASEDIASEDPKTQQT
jgi:RNA polymerase sigma-70 factor (ECF subfamily)